MEWSERCNATSSYQRSTEFIKKAYPSGWRDPSCEPSSVRRCEFTQPRTRLFDKVGGRFGNGLTFTKTFYNRSKILPILQNDKPRKYTTRTLHRRWESHQVGPSSSDQPIGFPRLPPRCRNVRTKRSGHGKSKLCWCGRGMNNFVLKPLTTLS